MMMKQIGFLLTFLLIALCAVQVGTQEARSFCTNKGGLCQRMGLGCDGPIRTGPKFCTDPDNYECCTNCEAGTKGPCEELGGKCMNADAQWDGNVKWCNAGEKCVYCKQRELCKCGY